MEFRLFVDPPRLLWAEELSGLGGGEILAIFGFIGWVVLCAPNIVGSIHPRAH